MGDRLFKAVERLIEDKDIKRQIEISEGATFYSWSDLEQAYYAEKESQRAGITPAPTQGE